jgi:hypothetical protein
MLGPQFPRWKDDLAFNLMHHFKRHYWGFNRKNMSDIYTSEVTALSLPDHKTQWVLSESWVFRQD